MSEKAPEGLKITNQFRSKNGFVYDFKLLETRMSLNISPRESDADEGDWRVDAQVRRSSDSVVITGWGATRADAVADVGRSWASKSSELQFPTYERDAVVKMLSQVRAL